MSDTSAVETTALTANGRPLQRRPPPEGKSGQVSIRVVPLSAIMPSPANEELYRPVSAADPDILALADSIRTHGLREPVVITTDNYILSGHRRYAACRLAGLAEVPVRVEEVHSQDPRFLQLLREYNRQRVKSADEVVREELLAADPAEAHRLLREHRRQAAQVDADEIVIEGEKRRARISKAKVPFLNAIIDT